MVTSDHIERWIAAIQLSDYPFDEIFHMVNSESLPVDDDSKEDLSLYLSGTEVMTKQEFIEYLKTFLL